MSEINKFYNIPRSFRYPQVGSRVFPVDPMSNSYSKPRTVAMIKKSFVSLLLTSFVCLTAFSQSFIGYGYDNYAGVKRDDPEPGHAG